MSDVILKAEDLKKYFKIKGRKVVKAVDGVSNEVERGKYRVEKEIFYFSAQKKPMTSKSKS